MAQELYDISVVVQKDNIQVSLDYIGEGRNGDYDKDDPEDIPLMRVYVEEYQDGDWVEIHDGSACLLLPITTPIDKMRRIAERFLQLVLAEPDHVDQLVGAWTWIDFRTESV